MEGRGRPERGPREKAKRGIQSRIALPPHLRRVNAAAKQAELTRFTALLHHIDQDALLQAFRRQKRQASAGERWDKVTKYEKGFTDSIRGLYARVHTGRYRPQPVRRVYNPQSRRRQEGSRCAGAGGRDCPKRGGRGVEGGVRGRLPRFSYGFRPGRNPHMALDALHTAIMSQRVNWCLMPTFAASSTRFTTSDCCGRWRTGSPISYPTAHRVVAAAWRS